MTKTKAVWRGAAAVLSMAVLMLGTAGCWGGRALIKEAENPYEKAGALVLIFDSYQAGILELVTNPAVPLKEKQGLRTANRIASPAARALNDAAIAYKSQEDAIDAILTGGGQPDQKAVELLDLLLDTLLGSISENGPAIRNYQTTMIKRGVPQTPLLPPSAPGEWPRLATPVEGALTTDGR